MEYNKFSEQLQKKIDKARPKKGQRVQFISIGNSSIALPGTSLIYDIGTNKPLPIANLTGQKEVRDQSSSKDSLSITQRVQFIKDNAFTVTVYGGRVDQIALFDYLFTHPSNINNKDLDGYSSPVNGYKFKMNNPDHDAQVKLIEEENVNIAKSIIFAMSEEELADHAKGLFPDSYQYKGLNQIKQMLLDIAKTDPNKIKGLSQDVDVSGTSFVKNLEEAKIIENKNKQWSFVSSGDLIVKITPKGDPYKQIINFLMKDKELLDYLKDELEKNK